MSPHLSLWYIVTNRKRTRLVTLGFHHAWQLASQSSRIKPSFLECYLTDNGNEPATSRIGWIKFDKLKEVERVGIVGIRELKRNMQT